MDKLLEVMSELLPTIAIFGLAYYAIIGIISIVICIMVSIIIIRTFGKINKRNRF